MRFRRSVEVSLMLGVFLLGVLVAVTAFGNDAPLTTTSMPIASAMLKAAETTPEDVVYDLGCGTGSIIVVAAGEFGARAIGIEIDKDVAEYAAGNVEMNHVGHKADILIADATTLDLNAVEMTDTDGSVKKLPPPTVVTLVLTPRLLGRLRPRLEVLPAGTRIVAMGHTVPGWEVGEARFVKGKMIYRWRLRKTIVKQKVCGPRGCSYISKTVTLAVPY